MYRGKVYVCMCRAQGRRRFDQKRSEDRAAICVDGAFHKNFSLVVQQFLYEGSFF